MLAPDPDAAPVSEYDESKSTVWQFLAPDDNFAPPKAPPSEIFPPRLSSPNDARGSGANAKTNANATLPKTPQTPVNDDENDDYNSDSDDLNSRVLSACRDTSMFMRSPMLERKTNDKFLRFCASTTPLSKKLLKKMRSMIVSDSFRDAYLLRVRATRMGESAPDGYTPLMVAAYANHIDAAKLVLELAEEYAAAAAASTKGDDNNNDNDNATTYADLHLDRDMFGMTALHIAGERGNVEMIQLLLPLYKFPLPPAASKTTEPKSSSPSETAIATTKENKGHVPLVDLGGQTAFGRAVTSPVPKAKRNQRTLEKNLFSNNDLSIFGKAKPIEERMGSMCGLGLEYGTSDMPGMRGYMEDAISVETWVQKGSNSSTVNASSGEMALFAVCDGHGDNGKVSQFVASNARGVLEECIQEHEEQNRDNVVPSNEYWNAVWQSASLKLDKKLRAAHLTEGGSTGVFALVTNQEIVVANVGDSRCILACKAQPQQCNENAIEEAPKDENASVEEATENKPSDEATKEGSNETTEESVDAPTASATTKNENENEPSDAAPPALVEEESSRTTSSTTTTENESQSSNTIVTTALSEDHKPNLPNEAARVRMAGFDVESIRIQEEDGTETFIHKVVKDAKNQLAVSRAFGDFDYKANNTLSELEQAVIPLADVTVHTRCPDSDLYMVLACDGIWDVMENYEVTELVRTQVKVKAEYSRDSLLPDVADVLLQECLGKDSRDNMSAILVSLQSKNDITVNNDNDTIAPKTLDFGSPR